MKNKSFHPFFWLIVTSFTLSFFVFFFVLIARSQAQDTFSKKSTSKNFIQGAENKFSIVNKSMTSIANPDSSNNAKKTINYLSSEWWMVYLTAVLAIITALLAGYTWKFTTVRL